MSFISVEPQPRVVLEGHSNSLLTQFDIHLKTITDRYLAFFQERRNIEATYIDSLQKLHRKSKIVDTSFDSRAEPTTTRAAWDTVRDVLEREASTQQAFVDVLDNYVIKPLGTLKESNDETRKRIEEDLKVSAARYADHAENEISKLQQAYLKKYHPHSTEVSQRPDDVRNKMFGGKVTALFRGRREDVREFEPTKSEEVSDDDCRSTVSRLNGLRLMRAESLRDGYDCLEEIVFMPTVSDVLVRYMDGMTTTWARHNDLAKNTRAEVQQALTGTDTSNLRASFRRSLSFSVPPLTLYRNYRPGAYSDLIFGVPLVDVETNEDNVPKVLRMCIEEVEKRGLNAKGIYSVGYRRDAEVQLRRRFESEKSFSFRITDSIYSVAMLLRRYLWDLPEPLLVFSLQDYRSYRSNKAICTEIELSQLRSRIRELHPVHRASLKALLMHLFRIASHLDKNEMNVGALATEFWKSVLRGKDGVRAKKLVMEDLIQNVHTLFDEDLSPPPPNPSFDGAGTTTPYTQGSLFLSPELPQPAEVQAVGRNTVHRPGLVGGIPTSTQSTFSLPSDASTESSPTPSPTPLLSPLLGLSSSKTLAERVKIATKKELMPQERGPRAVETLADGTLAEVVSVPLTSVAEWRMSVAEWRLRQSQLLPQPDGLTIPQTQNPSESALSSMSDFQHSSATSLQTRMGPFSS